MKQYIPIGIDVSKDSFDVFIPEKPKGIHFKLSNDKKGFTELLKRLRHFEAGSLRVAVEATGTYHKALSHALYEAGLDVSELNPRWVKDFAKSRGSRVKTDRVDAKLISQFIDQDHFDKWTPMPQDINELRSLSRRRKQVVDRRTAAKNQLHAHLAQGDAADAFTAGSIEREIALFDKEADRLERQIKQVVKGCKSIQSHVARLRTIPSVGLITSVAILSEIPFISNFDRARQLVAFAGLSPSVKQSGTSVYSRGRMSKEGSSLLRRCLYMAAMTAHRGDNRIKQKAAAMKERGKPSKVAMGAAMSRILRIAHGLLSRETDYIDKYA